MDLLLILGLCLLGFAKVTLQSRFAKGHLRNTADTVVYNGLVFVAASAVATLLSLGSVHAMTWRTVLFGVVSGVMNIAFQMTYTTALSRGPISLTVLISSFSMLVPTLLSVVMFNERLGLWRIVGIGCICVSLVMSVNQKGDAIAKKGWFILAMATFLINGCAGAWQKVFATGSNSDETTCFTVVAHVSSALCAGVMWLGHRVKKGPREPFRKRGSVVAAAGAIGAILGVFQLLNTSAISKIDGAFFFPVYNGSSTVTLFILGIMLYRERYPIKQWLGAGIGLAAIVMMSV